jgi:pyruvate/2-oxoglutarate dehydrogenase complex dihydrolipoamide acyltransferase (E2) component
VIAYIGEPEDLKALEAESASNKPTAGDQDDSTPSGPATLALGSETTHTAQVDSSNRAVKATPAAKKEVRDRGLDLAEVHRSVGKDVLRRGDVAQFATPSAGDSDATQATEDVMGFTLVPLTPMRRIIAERMGAGSSVPTFTAEIEVDLIIGSTTEAAAEETGLVAGISVAAGSVDCNAGWVGGGAVSPGDIQINLGTCGVIGVVHENPELILDTMINCSCVTDSRKYLPR